MYNRQTHYGVSVVFEGFFGRFCELIKYKHENIFMAIGYWPSSFENYSRASTPLGPLAFRPPLEWYIKFNYIDKSNVIYNMVIYNKDVI